ncbi:MAG TPA: PEP-CTERM sorting domain-containing protein [Acetobacteraceae bacterium]|jgi:PEP-CTERM motif|nr:PEP-CTERM sorting domain-containing protein [Acetobacteraceae bacterium]
MFTQIWTSPGSLAGAAFGILLGFAPQAHAFPSFISLQDVTFSDGGTASGYFSLDVYGYLATPTEIVTTAGSVLPGATYDLSGSASNSSTEVDFTIPSPPEPAADEAGLSLIFALPLGSVEFDPITGGCEFTDYQCGAGTFRTVTGGIGVVPEPGSLAVFGGCLAGFAAVRWRFGRRTA